jgi:hypothetical protein
VAQPEGIARDGLERAFVEKILILGPGRLNGGLRKRIGGLPDDVDGRLQGRGQLIGVCGKKGVSGKGGVTRIVGIGLEVGSGNT